ncbi:PREDICTED: protein SMAX1-LIKE 7-like isoform X3 [Camelina sativa]|uniref:Protein SMAX1-LIKE 7-like isoform X1 n=1 Tax=Camelina sativa TaxID=90675 RepID=A0ABM1R4X8_CAMSA|nr:PREDICTED: protein SMAX1-LIKE 7-like isoform X4 [Camelina sativa]XP_010469911.1 PREDICTED: protein SMAX1-LIKE 7-like isoform X5 [Camelina sativa]XP_019094066.1 PREDICTED: protein SMAX1-LIKE 7-like isoform X1 [Camelina sativa]XP_019094067.1 PREDICTED: protein SMAX1-LIKE 7-like isoform X2 [Camelina sativa]XP_019094068.1 PREDICTED: protein SMAX1-LIKE 7-like isoform X3 [Camelina sativa]
MPTPVTTARQCLTEETARALDDAVSVARRRSHAQTTSLHAVSGLLTMPSSILREVCISRAAHNTPYSSRLQFRALELCVGVSLDRLPSSKSPTAVEEDPPVSNSLMAAIKRSQATQRRHPETYHLHQIHANNNTQTTSVLKVELKYFILSILDDPIVSRVFGEAGFRSTDIKLDVLHPPVTSQFSSRFTSRSRVPPLFLCNIPESDSGRARFGFPFGDLDENCRRIGEVLGRRAKKNPLLVGACGGEALKTFTDSINRGKFGFLPLEISGLSVVSVEISEVLAQGSRIDVKVDDLGRLKSGMVLNLGELKDLTSEVYSVDVVEKFVLKLSDLLKLHREKLWFIASASSNETYLKLIERFPMIDKEWNLHLLPITSSSQGVYPKSSLMGSFVPFGGFFSSTSDFRVPFSNSMNQTLPRCHLCNEKYEQEVAALAKSVSVIDDQCSEKLPSWLRNVEPEQDKGLLRKAKDDPNALAARIPALQKKWDDICQRIHQTPAFPKLSFQPVRPQFPLQLVPSSQTKMSLGSPTEKPVCMRTTSESFQGLAQAQNPPHQQLGLSVKISKPKQTEELTSRATNSPLSCVTTDLGLGTIYASKNQDSSTPLSLERRDLEVVKEKPMFAASRYCKDFKSLRELLSRKVGFQNEAVNAISEILCGYRDDESRRRNHIATTSNVWMALLGPDKAGKKKVASALAEVFCGGQDNCICVDFQSQDSLDDRFRGKTVVDYIAGQVARRADSVVFIKNVDKAEFVDQIRLSDAVRTGKLRDSHGREIGMKNVIVVATFSGIDKYSDDCHVVEERVKYTEERVLSARNWKLQIQLAENASNVIKNGLNKRRQEETETGVTELRALKSQRSFLDLNLPVDETEANADEAYAMSENTEAWLDEFVEQVDGKVTFKQIDFDGLAKNIKRNVLSHFHRYFGPETNLEIENDAILQILHALRWSSDEERTCDQWMQTVLAPSFAEARQKYVSATPFSVKLVASRDSPTEEEPAGIQFPARVKVI